MLSRAALKRMWFASIAHCFDAQNLPGSTPGHFVSSGPFSRLFRSNSVDLIFDARCTERGAASVPLGALNSSFLIDSPLTSSFELLRITLLPALLKIVSFLSGVWCMSRSSNE